MTEDTGAAPLSALLAFGAAALAFFTVGFVWALGAFVVVLVGSAIFFVVTQGPKLDERLNAEFAVWNRKYMCMQCGAVMSSVGNASGEAGLKVVAGQDRLDELIKAGDKIQAVKLLRERTGLGLAEALAQVEARAREL